MGDNNSFKNPWVIGYFLVVFISLLIGVIYVIDSRSSIGKKPGSYIEETSYPTIEKKPSECSFWFNIGVKDWTPVLDCRISWREFYEGYFPNENQVCYCNGYNSVR